MLPPAVGQQTEVLLSLAPDALAPRDKPHTKQTALVELLALRAPRRRNEHCARWPRETPLRD